MGNEDHHRLQNKDRQATVGDLGKANELTVLQQSVNVWAMSVLSQPVPPHLLTPASLTPATHLHPNYCSSNTPHTWAPSHVPHSRW